MTSAGDLRLQYEKYYLITPNLLRLKRQRLKICLNIDKFALKRNFNAINFYLTTQCHGPYKTLTMQYTACNSELSMQLLHTFCIV